MEGSNHRGEKKKFALNAFKIDENFTELYCKYGISTNTGYKWHNRFKEHRIAGLKDKPSVKNNSE